MSAVLILLAIFLGLALLPGFWVRSVIARHSADRPDFPGTGGEFARHLLDEMKLTHVGVEQAQDGDHYDPLAKKVRLLPDHLNGRSLSAVVIAAHEVGHAMQDATNYGPLAHRTRLAGQAQWVERIGSTVLILAPVMMIFTKAPFLLVLQLIAGLVIMSFTILMHAMTLPVEFDASFSRALPVLKQGGYLNDSDMKSARQILRAAAFTYVAAAAMSLLNVMRWIRVFRF